MKNFSLLGTLVAGSALAGFVVFGCGQQTEGDEASARIRSAVARVEAAPVEQAAQVLVCTRTTSFRHASIAIGKQALERLGEVSGAFEPTFTEELDSFEAEQLAQYDGIIFLNTTGDLFMPAPAALEAMSPAQQEEAAARADRLRSNLQAFVEDGGAFIGIHAATDTFHNWPWYVEMIGGEFDGHPWGSNTTVSLMIDRTAEGNPLLASLPTEPFELTEEIYQHKEWTAGRQQVLVRIDTEGTDMTLGGINRSDGDFPISWYKTQGRGRVFYCELGHNDHIYWNHRILDHYLAGIQWTLGQRQAPEPPGMLED